MGVVRTHWRALGKVEHASHSLSGTTVSLSGSRRPSPLLSSKGFALGFLTAVARLLLGLGEWKVGNQLFFLFLRQLGLQLGAILSPHGLRGSRFVPLWRLCENLPVTAVTRPALVVGTTHIGRKRLELATL
jgi:hypothetical protein